MELAAEMAESIVYKVESMMLPSEMKSFVQQSAALRDLSKSLRAKLLDTQVSATKDQVWLNKVRDALYAIEHLVDQNCTTAADTSSRSFLTTTCFREPTMVKKGGVTKIVDMIQKAINEVTGNESHTAAGAASDLERRSEKERTLSATPPGIKRDSDRNAIIRMLQHGDSFSAVVIFGMAGLGKTTLAQLVFNDSRLPDLDLRLWVWLGNELNPSSIIPTICNAITSQTSAGQSNKTPQEAIRGRKLLLVLDDCRSLDEGTLVSIKDLMIHSSATKVVITTRSVQVATANYTQNPTTLYELGAISDEDARELFKEVAFKNDHDPKSEKDLKLNLGWELLKRTNNVPRTIKDLASLVNSKDPSKWKALMNADFSCVREGYSPFASDSELAFRLLPSPLKRCFAYSALFQQYAKTEMQQLVRLWIALGYIEEHSLAGVSQSLEEVAVDYYKALLDWSFFHDRPKDFELAKSVAANEMQVLYCNCTRDGYVLSIEPHDFSGMYHLFLNSTSNADSVPSPGSSRSWLKELIDSLPPQLRSFLKSQGSTVSLTKPICDRLFSRLRHLRALDLNSSKICMVPASIGLLKYLRYLNLSINDFTKLPDSITTLTKLQVLDLSSCEKFVRFPTHFSRLISLRHLLLDGCKSLTGMPVRLCKMTALQTLNLFVLGKTQKSCQLDELSSLNLKSVLTYSFASQS